jgi:GNAT superfamily N-acetyltransferase
MTTVNLVVERDDALKAIDAILPVYREAYAEPPYYETPDDIAGFARGWPRRVQMPGFRLATATVDGGVVGAGFELAILAPHRRHGTGRRLVRHAAPRGSRTASDAPRPSGT